MNKAKKVAAGVLLIALGWAIKPTSTIEVINQGIEQPVKTQETAESIYWETFENALVEALAVGHSDMDTGYMAQRAAEKAAKKYYSQFELIPAEEQMPIMTEIIERVYSNED